MEVGGQVSKQNLILGTHTSEGEQNYLMRAEVQLPLADAETEARGYDDERGEVGGFGAVAGKVQVSLSCWATRQSATGSVQAAAAAAAACACKVQILLADAGTEARGYDGERGEAGSFDA